MGMVRECYGNGTGKGKSVVCVFKGILPLNLLQKTRSMVIKMSFSCIYAFFFVTLHANFGVDYPNEY